MLLAWVEQARNLVPLLTCTAACCISVITYVISYVRERGESERALITNADPNIYYAFIRLSFYENELVCACDLLSRWPQQVAVCVCVCAPVFRLPPASHRPQPSRILQCAIINSKATFACSYQLAATAKSCDGASGNIHGPMQMLSASADMRFSSL